LGGSFVAFGESGGSDPFDDDLDTKTVINDLFGEEIELMDKERLMARYDVLDLEDIGISYDDSNDDHLTNAQGKGSAKLRASIGTPFATSASFNNVSSLRKKSVSSNFSGWDEFDISLGKSADLQAKANLAQSFDNSN